MKTLTLIGGTMGVGKTTLCQDLKGKLPNCVFLDGDWCWDADPFQVTEETKAMVMDNICHLLNNFLNCSAYENVLFCWVMDQQEIIDGILSSLHLDGVNVKVLSLLCDEEILKQRLSCDIAKGIRKDDIIERSLARIPLYEKLNNIKIDSSGKSVEQLSDQIIALLSVPNEP